MAESTLQSNSVNSAVPERDALYYLTPITFQVENSLFKVPRHSFTQNSSIFRDMFSIPQSVDGSSSPPEGSSDSNPVRLPVNKGDFRRLLEVLYPLEIPSAPAMPKEGWISVLRLATMWEMDKVRGLAISQLTNAGMGSVEKIVLAKELHVPQWLRSGYQELVDRDEVPSMEDSDRIGYPSAIRVFHVREDRLRRVNRGHRYGYGDALTVENIFREELAEHIFREELATEGAAMAMAAAY